MVPLRVFLLTSFIFLSSCQLHYITRSAYYQAQLMQSRVTFDYALKNYDLTEQQRQRIHLALEVRQFMKEKLGLDIEDNYTRYVQLDQDYVTYAVNAAYKNSLKRFTWSFPIVGKVPYKGYFRKEHALEEAKELKEQDLDTYVRGVTAYSTLGWFEDPLLSSMLRGPEHRFVNTLIHETVHANLYIEDHSKFNERVASFLGQLGAEAFYVSKNQGEQVRQLMENETHDELLFSEFITKELTKLRSWYKEQENKKTPDVLELREKKFAEIKSNFKQETLPKMRSKDYNWFLKQKLNNAFLLLLELYNSDFQSLDQLAEKYQRDFKKVFAQLKKLEDMDNPEETLATWVSSTK